MAAHRQRGRRRSQPQLRAPVRRRPGMASAVAAALVAAALVTGFGAALGAAVDADRVSAAEPVSLVSPLIPEDFLRGNRG